MFWLWWGIFVGCKIVAVLFGLVVFIDWMNYMDLQRRLREQREKGERLSRKYCTGRGPGKTTLHKSPDNIDLWKEPEG